MTFQSGNITPLLRLNLDVLLLIASSLDTASLSRLSQTCHFMHYVIEEHGWKSLWLSSAGSSSPGQDIIPSIDAQKLSPSSSSSSSIKFKRYLQIDKAWATKTFQWCQFRLPVVTIPSGKVEKHQPQPLLLLTPMALVLFTGSEMRLWSKAILQSSTPVQLITAQVFYLDNPAGLDSRRPPGTAPMALWDICACTQVDVAGQYIAIGRLNGLVEIVKLSTMKQQKTQKNRVQVDLIWLWRDSSSIQAIHACPSSGLLVIASKSGSIALFKYYKRGSNGFKVPYLLEQWNISTRPWSIFIHGSQWLAVGISDVEPILIYPMQKGSHKPQAAIHLATTGAKATSVYALQTKMEADRCILLAGCYDGVIRCYDVEQALSSQEPDKSASIIPQRQLRDRFDPSAIYCLCVGIGQRGNDLAAGTARHGVCKVFRSTMIESDSFSMFAAHPSQSPTHSLVGQYDRLFGVTDAFFWQIDLRPRFPSSPSSSSPSMKRHNSNTIAFYKHGDMVLESSRYP